MVRTLKLVLRQFQRQWMKSEQSSSEQVSHRGVPSTVCLVCCLLSDVCCLFSVTPFALGVVIAPRETIIGPHLSHTRRLLCKYDKAILSC